MFYEFVIRMQSKCFSVKPQNNFVKKLLFILILPKKLIYTPVLPIKTHFPYKNSWNCAVLSTKILTFALRLINNLTIKK